MDRDGTRCTQEWLAGYRCEFLNFGMPEERIFIYTGGPIKVLPTKILGSHSLWIVPSI